MLAIDVFTQVSANRECRELTIYSPTLMLSKP
jgi:hypothetical protein